MKAEIVSVGTELLLGQITDTNASYLAAQLPSLGIDLYWISQVGDNLGRLTEVLRRAWGRSDLTLVTGGLGPTEDDITREGIARIMGEEMAIDPALEAWLRGMFRGRGWGMPERNIKQAMLIPSAQPLPNPRGTAPGWWVEKEDKLLAAMPGVPREMYFMWENEVAPRLRQRLPGDIILSRTLKTLGFSEAAVDEMISPILASTNPTVGVYAKDDGIQVRLTAKAPSEEEAREILAPLEDQARALLSQGIWGVDDDTLGSVAGSLLQERGWTLATMESCTGGLLASTITDTSGASAYYNGGLVAYTREMKLAFGVDPQVIESHGMVSAQCAQAMAQAARERLEAQVGVGITGVAGPEEMEGKAVGTVYLCVVTPTGMEASQTNYPARRLDMKRWAVLGALGLLLRSLREAA